MPTGLAKVLRVEGTLTQGCTSYFPINFSDYIVYCLFPAHHLALSQDYSFLTAYGRDRVRWEREWCILILESFSEVHKLTSQVMLSFGESINKDRS